MPAVRGEMTWPTGSLIFSIGLRLILRWAVVSVNPVIQVIIDSILVSPLGDPMSLGANILHGYPQQTTLAPHTHHPTSQHIRCSLISP
ncbi:hypothetical protein EB796_015328 [Bugula neritina]|uniref:Uncharacterized protein n=1 Tax=Bugula neritina TaxID=10212 RepID=A0A7J7JL69_BUGNE|nr:hypothetical protein EB796_015328 [Bugula neritina]